MASLLNMSGGSLLNKGLPYDAEIEYLESTGTQWIETNFSPNQNTNIYTEVYVSDGKISTIFETRDENNMEKSFGIVIFNNFSAQVQLRRWGRGTVRGKHLGKLNIRQSGKNLYFNDNLITSSKDVNFSINRTILLFALNSPVYDVYTVNGAFRCYRFIIYDNDLTVLDFIPVRIGTTGYMYDKVSGQLFGNAGTGSFILGNDI